MRISHYSFGRAVIDGREYAKDVIVFPDRVESPWWRREGHSLCLDDLESVLAAALRLLIVGTGSSGVMRVPPETLAELESRGIQVRALRTAEAVRLFNDLEDGAGVVAALHLTC